MGMKLQGPTVQPIYPQSAPNSPLNGKGKHEFQTFLMNMKVVEFLLYTVTSDTSARPFDFTLCLTTSGEDNLVQSEDNLVHSLSMGVT